MLHVRTLPLPNRNDSLLTFRLVRFRTLAGQMSFLDAAAVIFFAVVIIREGNLMLRAPSPPARSL